MHKWRFESVSCVRCGAVLKLHLRDDWPVPFPKYCRVCWLVNKQEVHLLEMIAVHSTDGNADLWRRRLEAHLRLNPVGSTVYRSYWDDEFTHSLGSSPSPSEVFSGVDV